MRQEAGGFTLLELMTTLAVLAVGLGLCLPAFQSLHERTRSANVHHLLTASLMSARNIAVTRGHAVTVCPSGDGLSCRDDSAWEDGWIIFSDPDRSGEPKTEAAVVRRIDAIGGRLSLRSSAGRPRIRYLPSGRAHGSNASISLCTPDARLLGSIVINNSGRARSERNPRNRACPHTR